MDQYQRELERLLQEDIDSVRKRENTAFDELLAVSGNRVVLFGAGRLGTQALQCLRSIGVEPLAFADNNRSRWNTEMHNVVVLSPQTAAERFGRDALFLVTIWSLGHRFRQTRQQLESLGCAQIAAAASLRWRFPARLLPDFAHDLPHKLYQQADEVRAAAFLWADDYSRCEYLNQVRWRGLGDYDALGEPDSAESYFPDNIFSLRSDEMFVDCGAYIGDTAQRLIERQHGKFRGIVAVEPDPTNFRRLQHWRAALPHELAARIRSHNLAVGSVRAQVRFNSDGTEGAAISETGAMVVECIPLNELLSGECPTYIKMDIEGAEIDALKGASALIAKYRPVLAICVYHRQDDLWRVPLLIKSLGPQYQLFLRPHDVDGWQTVCYAVPPERALRPKEL